MRVRQIIIESLKLPLTDYKSFLTVFLLLFLCEVISQVSYSFKIGEYYLLFVFIRSIVSLILIGLSMNIVNHVVFNKSIHLHFKQHFKEGLNEYVLTLFYLLIPLILSLFFIYITGLYSIVVDIREYILQMDIDSAALTVEELSHVLPESMTIDFLHTFQLHSLFTLFLYVLFTSFSFIGRILMFKYGNLKMALDLRNIFIVVRNIGCLRFMKFVLIFTIILIFVVNLLVILGAVFDDVLLSTFFEVFLLFFATNAFYKLYFDNTASNELD
ncbi:hypothetical protein AW729_10135 [Methanosphaera sp. BMS]|nr:hypothetical protein AW729_10135 [Methanosphaera sp. BMS]